MLIFILIFIHSNELQNQKQHQGWKEVLAEELARRFENISLVLVEPEHMKSTPRTSLVLGVLIYPLDYLIRIIRFVLFRIIECVRI